MAWSASVCLTAKIVGLRPLICAVAHSVRSIVMQGSVVNPERRAVLRPVRDVDVAPTQTEQFPAPGAGRDGHEDEQVELRPGAASWSSVSPIMSASSSRRRTSPTACVQNPPRCARGVATGVHRQIASARCGRQGPHHGRRHRLGCCIDRSGSDLRSNGLRCSGRRGKAALLQGFGGGGRNRTGVRGFAVRCMATLPPRRANDCKRRRFREPANKRGSGELPLRTNSGAGNESRTRDLNLGKVALYQLSYSRAKPRIIRAEAGVSKRSDGANR